MRQFDLHLSALSSVKKVKALFDLGGCNNVSRCCTIFSLSFPEIGLGFFLVLFLKYRIPASMKMQDYLTIT